MVNNRASFFAGDDDGCLLHFDEAAVGALLEFGQEGIDFFFCLDELDLDGEMVGDFEDVRGVETVRGAESGYTFEHRGPVDAVVEEEVEQAGVNRDAVMSGAIAEIDGDFDGFA